MIDQQSKCEEPAAIRFELPTLVTPARLPWPTAVAIIIGLSAALWGLLALMASTLGLI